MTNVDLEQLADYLGGALDGTPAERQVRNQIATDPAWAAAYTELATATERAAADLLAMGSTPEPMPADVSARLTAMLAGLSGQAADPDTWGTRRSGHPLGGHPFSGHHDSGQASQAGSWGARLSGQHSGPEGGHPQAGQHDSGHPFSGHHDSGQASELVTWGTRSTGHPNGGHLLGGHPNGGQHGGPRAGYPLSGHPQTGAPAGTPGKRRARPSRRARRTATVGGVLAATCALVVGLSITTNRADDRGGSTTAGAADTRQQELHGELPTAGQAGYPLRLNTGTDYRPDTLASFEARASGAAEPAATAADGAQILPGVEGRPPGTSAGSTTKTAPVQGADAGNGTDAKAGARPGAGSAGTPAPGGQPPARVPAGLERLSDSNAMAACLAAVASGHPGTISAVDFASFQGRPALILLVEATGRGRQVVVVGPSCGSPGVGADERYAAKG